MSADNWAECPVCVKKAEVAKQAQRDAVQAMYGKVPVEEFDAMRIEANKPIGEFYTFREDYEFYLRDTTVMVSYSGHCEVCGSGIDFQDSRPIKVGK